MLTMLATSIDEILLRYRQLLDDAIRSLEENSLIDGFLTQINDQVADLAAREPSFWELRVVQSIHHQLKTKLHAQLHRDTEGDGQQMSKELADSAKVDIHQWLSTELHALQSLLDHPNQEENAMDSTKDYEDFADAFWRRVVERLESSVNTKDTEDDVDNASDDGMVQDEHPSYEAITFDDLQFDGGSINSAPGLDDIPSILEMMNDQAASEGRRLALQQLSQIPTLEITHCVMHFTDLVGGLARLFVDSDLCVARDSLRLMYDVVNHIEDPQQFLDLYRTLVDAVGWQVHTGTVRVPVDEIFATNDHVIASIDVIRLLHEVVARLPHHWIHFPQDQLATVMCGTLVLLVLDPQNEDVKACRVIDIFGAIDPMESWLVQWIRKAPLRAQLFASIHETGFSSELLQRMSRVRPFTATVNAFKTTQIMSSLCMLSTLARSSPGRELLTQWSKLPAHTYHACQYRAWLGLSAQFRLDVVSIANDKVFRFVRLDREVVDDTALALEDSEPLGELGLLSVVLAPTVMYLCEPSTLADDSILSIVTQAIEVVQESLLIHQAFLRGMFELCTLRPPTIPSPHIAEESDEVDPWFPFRHPRPLDTTFGQIQSTVAHRIARGDITLDAFQRRTARLLQCSMQCAARLSRLDRSTAAALAQAVSVCLDEPRTNDPTWSLASFLTTLSELAQHAQFSVAKAMADGTASVLGRLSQLVDDTTSDDIVHAVGEITLGMAQSTAAIDALVSSGLWQIGIQYCLKTWRVTGVLDRRALHLLTLAPAAEVVFHSEMVVMSLDKLMDATVDHLDVAIALNASPHDTPFHLREVSTTLASLRSVLSTQHAGRLLVDNAAAWTRFLEDMVRRHTNGQCQATPQNEDRCVIGFEMATAIAGCVPSMVAWFDLLSRMQVTDTDGAHAGQSVSACSFYATSVASSLDHVGGCGQDWQRPQPLYKFEALLRINSKDETGLSRKETAVFKLTPHMNNTVAQMVGSIEQSKRREEPLNMVMLSQATWELIGDMEKSLQLPSSGYAALTKTVALLVYELAMSGQCKLGPRAHPGRVSSFQNLPTDAERKLMNRYYKDYSSRLGLQASPTLLHVLFKAFGSAAGDCFPVTMLMILDQVFSEDEIVGFLEYCSTCRFISFLWPGIRGDGDDQYAVPTLLPLAYAAEMILEHEFPQILTSLRACDCSVLSLALRWHSQCYWNFFTWDTIALMVYLNFLYGAEFQVYLLVAVIKHMEPTIRAITAANGGDPARASVEMHQAPIAGFRFSVWRNFFLGLRSTYQDRIHKLVP